jgi:hypothetical protein
VLHGQPSGYDPKAFSILSFVWQGLLKSIEPAFDCAEPMIQHQSLSGLHCQALEFFVITCEVVMDQMSRNDDPVVKIAGCFEIVV